jgi:type II secretory pathway component PulF
VFLVVILTFFMLFIVPTLEMMFEEFDVRLPLAMSALILVSEQVGSVLAFLVVPIILIGLMFLFSESLRRTLRYSFLSRWLPSQRANRRAALLRVLSVPVELEQPLEPTLTAAAQFHPDARCRTRLLDVRRDSRSTDDVWHQLARRGFLTRHQTEQIQQITSPTLRAWTLRTLAAKLRFRAATRRDSLTRLIQFAPVLLLGLLVGWIAYAAIGTLYDLVLNLA